MRRRVPSEHRAGLLQPRRETGQEPEILTRQHQTAGEALPPGGLQTGRESHESQPPGLDGRIGDPRQTIPVVRRPRSAEPLPRGVVQRDLGLDRPQHAQLGQPLDAAQGQRRIAQQQGQLVPQARARKLIEGPFRQRHVGQMQGLGRDLEAEPQLQAHGAQDAGGVVDEREAVQHPQRLVLEVAPAAEEIDQIEARLRSQADRQGIDREVAPEEVLPQGRRLHLGERRGLPVKLAPGRGHVDVEILGIDHHRREEGAMGAQPAAEGLGQEPGEFDPIPLDHHVQVPVLPFEQQVARETAHEIGRHAVLARDGGDRLDARQQGRREPPLHQPGHVLALFADALGPAVDPLLEGGELAVQVPEELHAGDEAERPPRGRVPHQHEAGLARQHPLPHLLGRRLGRDPFELGRHHRRDRPRPQTVLEGGVEELPRHGPHHPALPLDRRGVDPPGVEAGLGPLDRGLRRERMKGGDHQVARPRRRRQGCREKFQKPLPRFEQGGVLEPGRGGGGMPSPAGEFRQDGPEIHPFEMAAGDQRHPVPLAEEGEEERQIEHLQAARDERRQLLQVLPQLDLDDPHPVPADAVHLQPLGHAVEHVEPLGVERTHDEAPHRCQIATLLDQPGGGREVPRAGGGVGQGAGVLVDAHQQEVRLFRRAGHPAPSQLLGQQRRGRAGRRIDDAPGELQVRRRGRVVVVGPDLDPGIGRQPVGHDTDAVALPDVAEDHPPERRGVDLLMPDLGHLDAARLDHPAHRPLARAREEELRLAVQPPRHERRREGVEVGADVGGDQLHGPGLYRPARATA